MPQELVDPDQFLERLGKAFSDPSSSGSIWLTHKRYIEHDGDAVMTEEGDNGPQHEVLIRCTNGDVEKFSSRIPASRLPEFHSRYGNLLKSCMAPSMRKRDKKKEKARTESAAKKRREVYVDVEIGSEGKRGKGHRQRSRKVAAQKKKEAERERIETREAAQQKSGSVAVE